MTQRDRDNTLTDFFLHPVLRLAQAALSLNRDRSPW